MAEMGGELGEDLLGEEPGHELVDHPIGQRHRRRHGRQIEGRSVGAPGPAIRFVAIVTGEGEDVGEFFQITLDGAAVDGDPLAIHERFD